MSGAVTSFVTTTIQVGEHTRPAEIVNRLWPLASLADRYDAIEQRLISIAEHAPNTKNARKPSPPLAMPQPGPMLVPLSPMTPTRHEPEPEQTTTPPS